MLEPLSGMDAGFLYMETPSLHMHTLKLAIIDPSAVRGGISFAQFQRGLEKKLRQLPSFRQRVIEIPFGLGHPVWAPDPEFELSNHIRHRCLRAPGDRRQLEETVSEIAGSGLPRRHPLWEITMIEGLAGGRIAFLCKIHHSMADGTATLQMLLRVLQEGVPLDETPSDEPPTRWEIARYAMAAALWRLIALPVLIVQTLAGLWSLMARAVTRRVSHGGTHGSTQRAVPFATPPTPFNGALTPDRIFRTVKLPLDDFKEIRRVLGVTLNDVVLGVCAGALRMYLHKEGCLPDRSLVAGVPTNTRPDEQGRLRGNHVGHLMTPLYTEMSDPIARVRAIHDSMSEAKERHALLGPEVMERWFEYTPPTPFSKTVQLWSRHRVADRFPPPINLIVSNVPGPAETQSIGDAQLEALYSVGPILEGVGLNFTAWSYAGSLNFVALACPLHLEKLEQLSDLLPAALEELQKACSLPPVAAHI